MISITKEQDRLQDLFLGEYLHLGDISNLDLVNPFDKRTRDDLDNPHIFLLNLMRNPKYFSFTCKYIFNVELAPFQLVILEELWNRKYPMLIASRGASKSFLLAMYAMLRALLHQGCKIIIVGAAFRQAKVIFEYCEAIWHNAPVLRDLVGGSINTRNGPRRDIDRCTCILGESVISAIPLGDGCLVGSTQITLYDKISTIDLNKDEGIKSHNTKVWSGTDNRFVKSDEAYNNGLTKTKKIVTRKGFSIEGTLNHKLKVLRNNIIEWSRLDEMVIGDRILIDRTPRWHNGNFSITIEQAYAVGLMIGDGSWTNKYFLLYTTNNEELIKAIRMGTDLDFKSKSDDGHYKNCSKKERSDWLSLYGFEDSACYAPDKYIPSNLMKSNKEAMAACISGLFDTDGTAQLGTRKGGTSICISFSTTSEKLIDQIQYILLHFGIISTKTSRQRPENDNWYRTFELLITGQNVKRFAERINFRLSRKRIILEAGIAVKTRWVTCDDEVPGAKKIMLEVINNVRIKRGRGNKDTEKVSPSKIKQYKVITRELIRIFIRVYNFTNHPNLLLLKELSNENIYYDKIESITDNETITYDIHVPETHEYCANGFFSHNTKIRGMRANFILADEMASIPRDIYENVVSGFAAVSASPIESMKNSARIRVLKSLGLLAQNDDIENQGYGNQAVLSGTAYYAFNSFCDYWKQYKAFIETKGDQHALEQLFHGEIPPKFDYRDFSIIRLPVELLPEGFMDEKHVARSKATVHSGIFNMEFSAVFATDSNGFFKRSLIESCVTSTPIDIGDVSVQFSATIKGNPRKRHIYGVDPASEQDNFSIVILEVNDTHVRIVYCWTTTRISHKEKVKAGLVDQEDFYGYCARKIRSLMKIFPCERIAMDAQGGGIAVEEALHDPDKMEGKDIPIWPIINGDKDAETDGQAGLHILEMVQFADAKYTHMANHGMRKDFEDKVLLFPFFDALSGALAIEQDKHDKRLHDTLEDCVMEIEELKDELATIVHTQTGQTGRDKWDTPEVKMPGGRKGRLRKDRYSALLMANMTARSMARALAEPEYSPVGAIAGYHTKFNGALYVGPAWFTEAIANGGAYGKAVPRGVS